MSEDLRARLAHCGDGVVIDDDVRIERPELLRVGDNVRIGRGFHCQGDVRMTVGANVTFHPWCFVQGAGEVGVEEGVEFFPSTYISTGDAQGRIRIGRRTHFAAGCALYGKHGLTIGAYCNIAAHVVLSTVQHDPRRHPEPMALAPQDGGPITLADDVWIGANATVTPRTAVARGCIVGAGAVLTRDTEPYGVYGGVPARRLRERVPPG
ncbi:hypothetical protein [Jiangella alkaliphila]|uniref:Transferase hexapeptide (Six repeat-containing protein) n=1 Tax=Jiangella alkaliphila TaxID=419479 RepID=A0A1H2K3R7_9ACTN|nr:hypothetical protein [Jiangella alkaliphila]SDU63360.1 transferase hexapeptide (six repeat-containing protein) [Jiangella alkaliphila]